MNTPLQPAAQDAGFARSGKSAKTRRKTYVLLLVGWLVLVAIGVTGAVLYSEHLKQQITADIAKQTTEQLQSVEADYQKQVDDLRTSVNAEVEALEKKVEALNELLAFTKDSANSKTDNSNQLYTQLEEVKKKLDELQHNLDVLK
ncbi:hypothetical protein B5M42_019470 [Paenibacillus athensensis]|uniref:Uncharacterized protein n=1 Tax=Paenibacillus athensensis TaxID=1967502 RepID=A0A4Y8Q2Q3_9BACL|nr:hypothetical protein [Paenibacillus athensensis]MCD1260986.1 hypothetical protein [Paenibacillus athensensis]